MQLCALDLDDAHVCYRRTSAGELVANQCGFLAAGLMYELVDAVDANDTAIPLHHVTK